jgi:hypothetical protein
VSADPGYRLPNLLILGAAKSGTTYLHGELARHPDVFMSAIKEPSFFSDSFQVVRNPIAYADLFAAARDQRWVGEASHVYMSHPEGARVLRAFLDPERFIVILRDPVERAVSLFNHMSRHGREVCRTIEAAVEREQRRLDSARLRWSTRNYFLNFGYVTSGLYGEQLQRYIDTFGRDRFCVLFYDELRDELDVAMKTVYEFLGVPEMEVGRAFSNVGGRKARVAPLSAAVWKLSLRMPPRRAAVARQLMERLTSPATSRPSAELRAALYPRFARDLALLESLIGRPTPRRWHAADGGFGDDPGAPS